MRPRSPYDLPTDRFARRQEHARSRTLAILLPVLVIAGSGIWLVVLLYG